MVPMNTDLPTEIAKNRIISESSSAVSNVDVSDISSDGEMDGEDHPSPAALLSIVNILRGTPPGGYYD